jgi:hypothetical protein
LEPEARLNGDEARATREKIRSVGWALPRTRPRRLYFRVGLSNPTSATKIKIPEQHRTQVLFGDFSILSKHNCYLRSVLQRIHQSVIVIDGYAVNSHKETYAPRLSPRHIFKLYDFGFLTLSLS